MGCPLSAEAPRSWPPGDDENGGGEDDVVQVSLSAQIREVIKQSWREIQDDVSRVGVIMFVRIMSFIEKSVARIDQDERLDQLILDLGRKHYVYDAPPKYYEFVGAEFIQAMKERWTSEQEDAWKTLFLYISSTMKRGFKQEQRNQRNQRNQSDVLRRPSVSVSKQV
ncbi:uncharacterized protein LOC130187848 isoform X2 [Seriola aureovittata]|uniref:uncharacterized protein LOC130187848 isoform X2 n=1 Tax=Seriola aureovittata TaxID=2871759 RepID=UPI0024BE6369|nr:uncharacterized protein LOC130187848 isoform X2 [Seriola aureovittata]